MNGILFFGDLHHSKITWGGGGGATASFSLQKCTLKRFVPVIAWFRGQLRINFLSKIPE